MKGNKEEKKKSVEKENFEFEKKGKFLTAEKKNFQRTMQQPTLTFHRGWGLDFADLDFDDCLERERNRQGLEED